MKPLVSCRICPNTVSISRYLDVAGQGCTNLPSLIALEMFMALHLLEPLQSFWWRYSHCAAVEAVPAFKLNNMQGIAIYLHIRVVWDLQMAVSLQPNASSCACQWCKELLFKVVGVLPIIELFCPGWCWASWVENMPSYSWLISSGNVASQWCHPVDWEWEIQQW